MVNPVVQEQDPCQQEKKKNTQKEINHLLVAGMVKRLDSPFASPLHMALKTANGETYQLCGNYCQLNKIAIQDSYPYLMYKC